MHESAPWRAIEDSPPGSPQRGSATVAADAVTQTRAAASRWAAAGLAVAGLVGGAAIWLVVAGGGHGSVVVDGGGDRPAASAASADAFARSPDASGTDVVVDVQGAVIRPGIVHLPPGARVAEAVAAAGGYGPRVAADRVDDALNLAAVVKDGDQIVVPSRDDPQPQRSSPAAGSDSQNSGGPIDLNHATATELDGLPGVGPVTATKIIAARDEQPFGSVDDLRTRKIVGAATFDKIKDLVAVP